MCEGCGCGSEKKGFNDPLIDTKTMLNNVTYWIDNKGGAND